MKKTKLFLVITKSNWGGAQKYVFDIANSLKDDKNFDITVFFGGNGEMVERLKKENIKTVPVPHLQRNVSIYSDLYSFWFLLKVLFKEKPDILHLNSSKIGAIGALAGRIAGVKKIIFTSHGWAFNEVRPNYQKKIIKLIAYITTFLSHKTICVSFVTFMSLDAPKFLEKKIFIIHNGIRTPDFYDNEEFFKDTKTPTGIKIVSIGELHKNKGFDIAIENLSKIRNLNWTYHILGEGEQRENLQNQIKSLGLQDKIFLHGHIEEASRYLKSFDLFLLPSRTEALGYVAVEAIYAGLPIIAHKVGGIPEVLENDVYTKLVNIDNPHEMISALSQFINNPITVSIERREKLMKRFSIENMMEKTLAVYNNLPIDQFGFLL